MYYISMYDSVIIANDIPTFIEAKTKKEKIIEELKEKKVNYKNFNIKIEEEKTMEENNNLKKIEIEGINIFGENKQKAIILGNIDIQNQSEKIKFYNEVINCENNIDEILNTPKEIKYIHIDKQRISKPDNPKGYEETPRIVFYFTDNTSVISFSVGIYNALKRMVSVFGFPPYDFKIVFKQITKGKNHIYTIDVVE